MVKVSIKDYCWFRKQYKDEREETLKLIDITAHNIKSITKTQSCPARLDSLDVTLYNGTPVDPRIPKNMMEMENNTFVYDEYDNRFKPMKKAHSCTLS